MMVSKDPYNVGYGKGEAIQIDPTDEVHSVDDLIASAAAK